jgi:hypothetical protein
MLGRKLRAQDVPLSLHSSFSDLVVSHWAFAEVIEASISHEYETGGDGFEIWLKW